MHPAGRTVRLFTCVHPGFFDSKESVVVRGRGCHATDRLPRSKRLKVPEPSRLIKEICASPVDKAVQFYIEHYVISLPDEPRDGQELREMKWVHSRETRDIMCGGPSLAPKPVPTSG
ncbi:uncharacterized protein THITE_2090350 [Thermothielavioides terrestris NRRL 8126]|uniref:Uncharacterized protein n=1 Tax=Thermothielavioides terrestris (strain ATCC 38088 / NRRL 8126) TaxID=578455 RepID=G2RAB2_THETT|nr:uncharacterized protein THITE_2090350 [Thermothielavioides terrestris NRRL 8126]AEO68844.1 hypothetical protein THITE_2090350 [Thermothielavioides terrestris NRRL 8126]